jgi:hypothetical protein
VPHRGRRKALVKAMQKHFENEESEENPRSLVGPPGSPWGLFKIKFPISVSISSGLPGARYNAMRVEKEFA